MTATLDWGIVAIAMLLAEAAVGAFIAYRHRHNARSQSQSYHRFLDGSR